LARSSFWSARSCWGGVGFAGGSGHRLGIPVGVVTIGLIRTLADRGSAVLMVTHDIDTAFAVADRVVVPRLGRVVFDGASSAVTQPQLVHLMAGIVPPELAARATVGATV
jgi:hypothetical protein